MTLPASFSPTESERFIFQQELSIDWSHRRTGGHPGRPQRL